MGARLLCLCLLTALLGYYIYTPLPEDLAEPWTVMLVSAAFRAVGHLVRWWGLGGQSCGAGGFSSPWGSQPRQYLCVMLHAFQRYGVTPAEGQE